MNALTLGKEGDSKTAKLMELYAEIYFEFRLLQSEY